MDFKNILRILFLLLIVENGLFYIAIFAQGSNDSVFQAIIYFDVLLYLFLGIILILQGVSNSLVQFTMAGIAFIVWVVTTVIWRLELNFYSGVINTTNTNSISQTLNTVFPFYLIAGFFFAVGIFFLSKGIHAKGGESFLINLYGIINLISVILTLQGIGLIPKLFLVPLLGMIAYSLLVKGISKKYY